MVIEKARELGIALSETEEFRHMLEARLKLENDGALSGAVRAYGEKQGELVEILSREDAEDGKVQSLSSEIRDLEELLAHSGLFQELMQAQRDFQKLMERVNRVIGACIGAEEDPEHPCSGSCAECGGCKH